MSGDTKESKFLSTLTSNLLQDSHVHINLGQNLIVTTEDRLKGILSDYVTCLGVQDRWQTPASVLLALLFVLCTATFHDALGVPQATWQAVCLISTGLTAVWLLRTVYKAFRSRKTVADLIADIKKSSVTSETNQT